MASPNYIFLVVTPGRLGMISVFAQQEDANKHASMLFDNYGIDCEVMIREVIP